MQNEHNVSLILQSAAVLVKEIGTACKSFLSGLQQQTEIYSTTLQTVAGCVDTGCVDTDVYLLNSPPSIKQSEQPVDSPCSLLTPCRY